MRGEVKVWLSSDLTHAEELKRTPLDVAVPCPRCGGEAWDRVEWRADPDAQTARVRGLACRSCAHVEGAYPVGRRRWPEPSFEDDSSPLSDDPSAAEILEAASFAIHVPSRPIFPLLSLGQAGWGSESEQLEGVSINASDRGSSVEVWSFTDRRPLTAADRARMYLRRELRSTLPHVYDRDHDIAALKRRVAMRPLQAAADAATPRRLSVPVEGEPVEFSIVEHDGHWAAASEGIVVTGRNVAPGEVALRLLRPDDELASACGP